MEDKLKAAFEKVRMRDECAESIEKLIQNGNAANFVVPNRFLRPITGLAAAVVLVLLIVFYNADAVQAITASFVKPIKPTVYESPYYICRGDKCESFVHMERDLVTVDDGRLIFIFNDEQIDITDQISDEDAYIYTFTDQNGFLNFVAIGGTLGEGKDALRHIGFMYYIWRPDRNGDGLYNDGAFGNGSGHWNNEKDDYFDWYVTAHNKTREITFSQRIPD